MQTHSIFLYLAKIIKYHHSNQFYVTTALKQEKHTIQHSYLTMKCYVSLRIRKNSFNPQEKERKLKTNDLMI